jgi:hypothetical protein
MITIEGRNLPGRTFCAPDGDLHNVHVGVQERRDPVGLVPGDAPSAGWQVDVRVATLDDGSLDFKGPAVQGRRGERFLYLTWGDVDETGGFHMFRRAKLMLGAVDPALVRTAEADGRTLRARVDLTDSCGAPRCARVQPPDLVWSVA